MLEKKEREVVLPESKTKLTIRKLGPYDYVYTGQIPDSFAAWDQRAKASAAKGESLNASVHDFKPAEIEYLAKCVERAIVKVHQEKATAIPFRIVAKQPSECTPTEFSFFSLPSGDVDTLLNCVFGEETAEAPVKFFPS
jgi:hypothetical protein